MSACAAASAWSNPDTATPRSPARSPPVCPLRSWPRSRECPAAWERTRPCSCGGRGGAAAGCGAGVALVLLGAADQRDRGGGAERDEGGELVGMGASELLCRFRPAGRSCGPGLPRELQSLAGHRRTLFEERNVFDYVSAVCRGRATGHDRGHRDAHRPSRRRTPARRPSSVYSPVTGTVGAKGVQAEAPDLGRVEQPVDLVAGLRPCIAWWPGLLAGDSISPWVGDSPTAEEAGGDAAPAAQAVEERTDHEPERRSTPPGISTRAVECSMNSMASRRPLVSTTRSRRSSSSWAR